MNKVIVTIFALVATWGAAFEAKADLIFQLGTVFNGGSPSGSGPWLKADFHTVTTGTVTLTLTPNLTGNEFISDFAFNIKPVGSGGYLPSNVTVGAPTGISVNHTTDNAQHSPGFGDWKGWDFQVSFPTSNQHRFHDGTVVITLQAPGLTAQDFNYFNSITPANKLSFFVGAKVQGSGGAIGSPVPEAPTMIAGAGALVLLLLGIGVSSRRSAVIRIGKQSGQIS